MLLGQRPMSDWIRQYADSHQHPVNRWLHTLGIPMIVVSLAVAVVGLAWPGLWLAALALFVSGWVLQFVGHALEGKPPEFFKDWRFLLVGVRWWIAKVASPWWTWCRHSTGAASRLAALLLPRILPGIHGHPTTHSTRRGDPGCRRALRSGRSTDLGASPPRPPRAGQGKA